MTDGRPHRVDTGYRLPFVRSALCSTAGLNALWQSTSYLGIRYEKLMDYLFQLGVIKQDIKRVR